MRPCKQSPDRIKAAAANSGSAGPASGGSRSTCRRRRCPRPAPASTCRIAIAVLAAAGARPRPGRGDVVHIGELGLDGTVRPVPRGAAGGAAAAAPGVRGTSWCRSPTRPRPPWCPGAGAPARADLAALVRRYVAGQGRASPRTTRCAAASPRLPTRRPCPTCATSSARPRPGSRSRSPRRVDTTCSWSVRRAPARRCWPSGCPGCCPRLEPEHALEVTAIQLAARRAARGPERWCPAPVRRPAPRRVAGRRHRRWQRIHPRPARSPRPTTGCCSSTRRRSSGSRCCRHCASRSSPGEVAIARASGVVRFPARFQLVMAANPCPCGRGFGKGADCSCSPAGPSRLPGQARRPAARPGRPAGPGARRQPGRVGPAVAARGADGGGRARGCGPRDPGRPAGRRTVAGQRRGARAGDAPRAVPAAAARRPPTSTGPSSGARSRCAATTGCSAGVDRRDLDGGAHRPGRTWVSALTLRARSAVAA